MLSPAYRKTLEKQQYGLIGNHSAVKICEWTKKSLRDKGACYKEKFYGIKSHRCCQMTPSLGLCMNNCIYCWRDLTQTETHCDEKELDKPERIVEESVVRQRKLLSGFGGNEKADSRKYKEAQNPTQYAISLSGEPTLYTHLPKLIKLLHAKSATTFVVTNGLNPEMMEQIKPTQLYLSVDSYNKAMFTKIDRPLVKDAWETFSKALEVVRDHSSRTVLRLTMIKGVNMHDPAEYAKLIEKAKPMAVEVKAYMWVGMSRQRLSLENMPLHPEISEFAAKISDYCRYKIVDEHKTSRVVLMTEDGGEMEKIGTK